MHLATGTLLCAQGCSKYLASTGYRMPCLLAERMQSKTKRGAAQGSLLDGRDRLLVTVGASITTYDRRPRASQDAVIFKRGDLVYCQNRPTRWVPAEGARAAHLLCPRFSTARFTQILKTASLSVYHGTDPKGRAPCLLQRFVILMVKQRAKTPVIGREECGSRLVCNFNAHLCHDPCLPR